jgi:cytochrome d ubiquinol oxidase subunit I
VRPVPLEGYALDEVLLARWQFGITTTYHFLFVPLGLGLSVLVAIMQSFYLRTGDELYKRMTIFWGRLFVINFALGVATGIVQEFQFGMNWSSYSRFVGDVFGVPLAIEALLAFFIESTFLGIWLFGWNRLSKGLHLACIWLVAIGANLSALWILIANSWMQQPVGYVINEGRAELTDIFAVALNPHVQAQFPHTVLSGFLTSGLFVMGISAWHLLKRSHPELFGRSLKIALVFSAFAAISLATTGHEQAQHVAEVQPMKLAAMEALWETEQPASFSLFSAIDQPNRTSTREIKLPFLLSILANNDATSEVRGINDLQAEAEAIYGPGDYIPPVLVTYWAFRIMVGLGLLFIALTLGGLYLWWRDRLVSSRWWLTLAFAALFLPYFANTAGWIVTEMGRQPWIVWGLLLTSDGVSPNVSAALVWTSLIGFTLLYAALVVVNVYLLRKYAREVPGEGPALGAVHAY